jgi:exodeoxyribonuclease VII large subunit
VLDNARRRWPGVEFQVAYAAMQGPRAATEVMEALDRLERDTRVDVIVVARGGGSVEDLLPFSDEALVRAVHQLRTPVVSAIGHEPDQPLLDLVADVRASTPTDAAKLVVPDVAEELRGVTWARDRVRSLVEQLLQREQHGLDTLRSRPSLAAPVSLVEAREAEVGQLLARAQRSFRHRLDRAEDDLGHQVARVRALSPLATLQRGYSVLQDADGHPVTSVADLSTGAAVTVRVADGRVHATVDELDALDARSTIERPTTEGES